MGADGACIVLGNVAPRQCSEIARLAMDGRLAEAQPLQKRLPEADWQILSRAAAGLKVALNLLGFEAGVPRAPQAPCPLPQIERIRRALQQAGVLE